MLGVVILKIPNINACLAYYVITVPRPSPAAPFFNYSTTHSSVKSAHTPRDTGKKVELHFAPFCCLACGELRFGRSRVALFPSQSLCLCLFLSIFDSCNANTNGKGNGNHNRHSDSSNNDNNINQRHNWCNWLSCFYTLQSSVHRDQLTFWGSQT